MAGPGIGSLRRSLSTGDLIGAVADPRLQLRERLVDVGSPPTPTYERHSRGASQWQRGG